MTTKLVSLNIEGKKHISRVQKFLINEHPEIVCLMEVCEEDVLILADEKYPFVVFAQNDILGNIRASEPKQLKTGVAILSKYVISESEKYYFGEKPRTFVDESHKTSHAPILLSAKVGEFNINAVHFTWTPNATITKEQSEHLEKLLLKIKDRKIIMCGDFNIPRGNENYHKITKLLKDNIPSETVTTLDPILHYGNKDQPGKLKYVVDYIWSSTHYVVDDVRIISGVSDHCALVCTISLL